MPQHRGTISIAVPVLETARLRLRGHRLEDFANCAALWGAPAVTRYIGGRPFTEEEAWARMLRYVGNWALLGFGYWVIEEKCSGSFLGEGGFAENQRDIQPSLKGMLESGWVFSPSAHGQGYAKKLFEPCMRGRKQTFRRKKSAASSTSRMWLRCPWRRNAATAKPREPATTVHP